MKLSDRRDLRSLFFIAFHFCLLIWGLLVLPGWSTVLLIPGLIFTTYICFNINHNLMHLGMFESTNANIFLNMVLSIATGMPVTTIYVPHLINHHPNPNNEKDWMGAHVVGNRTGLWRIFYYTFNAQIAQMKLRPRSFFTGLPSERSKSLICETISLFVFTIVGLLWNPFSFVVHVMLAWILSSNILVFINFFLHDGCDANSEHHHSKTFTSKVLNFFLLNGGYHMAHHERPRMHWADLPSYHARFVRPKAGVQNEHPSMLRHFIKLYF
ncbi:MAG: fatty acid desaturase [Bdellovibrionaceae bacterium]|nr:fatty acid desaturase [Pseudobdellovibrionaceae bacterium]